MSIPHGVVACVGIAWSFCLLACPSLQAMQETDVLDVYPPVPGAVASTTFSVKVNGQPVFVEEKKNIAFVHFSFAGQADIEVTYFSSPASNLAHVEVAPAAHAPTLAISGNKVSFSLTIPRKLVVHQINQWAGTFRDPNEPKLFIFADPLEDNQPDLADPNVINVVDAGVDNTGATNMQMEIQNLLSALQANQTLYFPPGLYKVNSVQFRTLAQDCSMYLAGGARLMASDSPGPVLGVMGFSTNINCKIYGRGSISANGCYLLENKLTTSGLSAIRANYSNSCSVEGVLLLDPSNFTLYPLRCLDFTIRNVKIIDYVNVFPELEDVGYLPGTDGIDPDDCKNVVVEDCFICSGDDSVSVKSTQTSKRFPADAGNIHIRNNVHYQTAGGRGLCVTSLVGSPILTDVTFENIQVIHCAVPLVVTPMHTADTPTLTNIYFKNVEIGNSADRVIIGRFYEGQYPSYTINNMRFQNVRIKTVVSSERFSIYASSPGTLNFAFDGFSINGSLVTAAYPGFGIYGNATISRSYANTTPVIVEVSAIDNRADEYGGTGTFRFSRNSVAGDLTVYFQLHGSAKNNVDYAELPGSVVIPNGQSFVDMTLTPTIDDNAECIETVLLSLTNTHGSSYMIGPKYHAYMSIDDGIILQLDLSEEFSPSVYANATTGSELAAPIGAAVVEHGPTEYVQSTAPGVLWNTLNIPRTSSADNSGLEPLNTAASGTNNRWNNLVGSTFGNTTVIMVYKPTNSGVVTAAGPSGRKYFFSHELGNAPKNVGIFVSDNVHGPELRMGDSAHLLTASIPNFAWNNQTWYFIAASWSPGQKGRLYVRPLANSSTAQFAESAQNLVDTVPNGLMRFGVRSGLGGVLQGENADGKFAYIAMIKEYCSQAALDAHFASLLQGADLATPTASIALKYDFRFAGDALANYTLATDIGREIDGATISSGALNIPRTSSSDASGFELWESQPGANDHRWNNFFGNTFGEGSMAMLYKPNVSGIRKGANARMHFFSHKQGTVFTGFNLFNSDASGGPAFRIGRDDPNPALKNMIEAHLDNFVWNSGSWYFLGISWSVGGEARLYVRKQGESTSSARYEVAAGTVRDVEPSTMNGLLRIGTRSNWDNTLGGENADGKIRRFQIFGSQFDQQQFDLLSETAFNSLP